MSTTNRKTYQCSECHKPVQGDAVTVADCADHPLAMIVEAPECACNWCSKPATRQHEESGDYACDSCPERNVERDYLNVGDADESYEEFRAAYLAAYRPLSSK